MDPQPKRRPGLFSELKRRHVFRVAAAYAALGWLLIEVADTIFPRVALPDWSVTLLVWLVLLGFPIALLLAWAYDMTPEGPRRTPAREQDAAGPSEKSASVGEAVGPEPGTPSAATGNRSPRRSIWFTAGIVVALCSAWVLTWVDRPPRVDDLDDDAIAVLPFRVGGVDPSLEYLREGMMDLLAAKLNGDVGPRALDPRVVLSRLQAEGGDERDLTIEEAARVMRPVGASRLLMGSAVGSPAQVTLNARIVSVATGRVLEASATGPADSLPALVDRLIAQVLSLDAGEDERRLSALTSASPTALRAYLEGRRLYRRGDYLQAAESYQAALQTDSTFALAGIGLAEAAAMVVGAGAPSGLRGLDLAWAARDRLGAVDREYLAVRRGDGSPRSVTEALHQWSRATEILPDRAEVWYELGDRYLHFGLLVDVHDFTDRAAAAFDQAVALDSTLFVALQHRAWVAELQGDTVGLRRLLPILEQRAPEGFSRDNVSWIAAGLSADVAELDELRRAIDGYDFEGLLTLHIIPHLGWGSPIELTDAERALSRIRMVARTPAERRQAALLAYAFLLNTGRPTEAARTLDEARALLADPTYALREHLRSALYWDGDRPAAEAAAAELERVLEDDLAANDGRRSETIQGRCILEQWRLATGEASATDEVTALLEGASDGSELGEYSRVCALLLDALAATGRGAPDAQSRVRALDAAVRTGPPVATLRERANLALVRMFEELDDVDGAYRAARRKPLSTNVHRYLSSFLEAQARLGAEVGDRAAAMEAYRRYLDFRSDPEPALEARVESARQELAELMGRPG